MDGTRMPLIDKESLTTSLYELGAIKFGEFTLKSGVTSPIYIDLRLLVSRPATLRRIARSMQAVAADLKYDRIAAIPLGGLPIGVAFSITADIPLIYPRLEAKQHGTGRYIEGSYRPGETVLLVDDVISHAESKLEATNLLEAVQLKVSDIMVIVDRQMGGGEALAEKGYRLHSLLTLEDMLRVLTDLGHLPRERQQFILAWLNEQRSGSRYAS
jgi:orotate phosphoribosyltransferase